MVDWNDAQARAYLLTQYLPGNDVGVMFHRRNDDFIACLQEGPAIALGDQIDRFRSPADKDDLLTFRRINEAFYFFPRPFVSGGGILAQIMDPTVNVRVLFRVVTAQYINHDLRLLARGPIVEIHEGLTVHLSRQDRKVFADRFHVKPDPRRPGLGYFLSRFH